MKHKLSGLAATLLLTGPNLAEAVPVQFDYYGAASGGEFAGLSYSGSLTIDDSLFDGTSYQVIGQTSLLGFSMNASSNNTPLFSWGLSDLLSNGDWIFDSSSAVPDIFGQLGFISNTYSLIQFGSGSISSDFGVTEGDWTYRGPPPTSVPEPSTLALFGVALGGLGIANRRKRAT